MPGEEVCMNKDFEWHLTFDGSSTNQEEGVGIVFYAIDDTGVSLWIKLDFLYSNNEDEISSFGHLRLTSGNPNIVCPKRFWTHYWPCQWRIGLNEFASVVYRTALQKMMEFYCVRFEHIPRANNKLLDVLATLASKFGVPDRQWMYRYSKGN